MSTDPDPITLADILDAHRFGAGNPSQTVARTYERIRAYDDPALFITLRDEKDALADTAALEAKNARDLPLYGVPIAVKDNIDVAGCQRPPPPGVFVWTKARCDRGGAAACGRRDHHRQNQSRSIRDRAGRYALALWRAAQCVARRSHARRFELGIGDRRRGRTRADFARHGYGGLRPRAGNVQQYHRPEAFPWACVECRCRAGLPDAGLRVDLCADGGRCMDRAAHRCAGFDAQDPFSRDISLSAPPGSFSGTRLGILASKDREFFADADAAKAYEAALARAHGLGACLVEFDFGPFRETARLLYEGPWIAERWSVVEELARREPEAIHPITRGIIEPGASRSAVETFRAFYRLAELRAEVRPLWNDLDALLLPTAPRLYTLAEVEADNVRLNSRLGTYTNFVNLLDLCGISVPRRSPPIAGPTG